MDRNKSEENMKRFAIVRTIDQNVSGNSNMVLYDGYENHEGAMIKLEEIFANYELDNSLNSEQDAEQLAILKERCSFSDDGKNYFIWEYECQTEGSFLSEKNAFASNVRDRSFEVIDDDYVDEDEDDW
jgi:hypothetical protein